MQAKTNSAVVNQNTTKKVPLTTSFDNTNDNSLYRRLCRYAEQKGLNKPQDVVRLAVSKFLDKEDF